MQFRIANTFTASLGQLPNDQQRAAKATAFDLQTNIAHPGLSLHRVTGAKDPDFWSARVNLNLRIILHRAGENVVLCYVDNLDPDFWSARVNLNLRIILHRAGENVVLCYVDSHDDAYRWA